MKYIFLILAILVIFFIFYRKFHIGRICSEAMTGNEATVEPTCSSNTYDSAKDLPLREYFVKSSFNAAYDNNVVSDQNILQRIKDGYRFLDLNVFTASGGIYVGYSPDNTPKIVDHTIPLSAAMECISKYAFTSSTGFESDLVDVHTYPLFVHIRAYRRHTSDIDIVSQIAIILNGSNDGSSPPSYASHYLRDENGPIQISGCTPLSKIMGKIVLSMDIVNILQVYSPTSNIITEVNESTTSSLQSFVNILTGGSTMPAYYEYRDPALNGQMNKLGITESLGSLKSNVKNMYIAYPHPTDNLKTEDPKNKNSGIVQPDIKKFALNCSIQFIPMRVYLGDPEQELRKYVNIFKRYNKPMVPMANVYVHLNGDDDE